MKNLVYILGMMVVMGLSLISCGDTSSDYEGMAATKKDSIPETKPEPKGEEPKDSVNWGIPWRRTLNPIGEPTATTHMWHGYIIFTHASDTLTRCAEMPVGYELTPSEGFSYSKTNEPAQYAGMSASTSNSQNTTYGTYYEDGKGNTLRKVTTSIEVRTSEFTKMLTMSRVEGFTTVNGREESFLAHTMSAQFVSLDSISGKEVEANDSIFNDVTYELTATAKFTQSNNSKNQKTYVLTARHTVRYFVRVKEKATPTPATPTDWKYVLASLVVNPNGSVEGSKGAFSICICLKNEKTKQWAIAITKTFGKNDATDFETHYFPYSDYPTTAKVNSAIMYNGKWVPAYLNRDKKDSQKWWYEGKYNNLSISMQEADMMGIKNFTGNHTAENTAWLNAWGSDYATDGSLQVHNAKGIVVFTIK